MTAPFPNSWYAASARHLPEQPPLEGDTAADVCVIGAGYTGLTAALDLAARGMSVVVLEAERIGWGASGRNGGQIVTGFNKPVSALEKSQGQADARLLWDLAEESKRILAERVSAHHIDCDLRWGYYFAALKDRHRGELADMNAEWRALGYDKGVEVPAEKSREYVDSPTYCGGLFDAGGGQLHPLNYALGLGRAALEKGVVIHEGSFVTAIETEGERPVARTARGTVTARHLVLAGDTGLGRLNPGLGTRTLPCVSYIIATEPMAPERAKALIPAAAAVADVNWALNYFHVSADNRLVFGGGVSYTGRETPGWSIGLRKKMLKIFPQLSDLKIEFVWSGPIGITVNRMPHIGRIGRHTWFAHGYSGQGVAFTGLCGRLMADAIAGTEERFDVMARVRHMPFYGGAALRMPLLVLATSWFRLRDKLA